MAKLQDFISQVKHNGLARTNRYSIILPNILGINEARLIGMYCDQLQLPSSNVSTQPNRTWGETREAPTEKLYENITLSVYCDTSMIVKSYFDTWIDKIQNPDTRAFNYYKSYIEDVVINVETVKEDGASVYGVKLYECYPKSIGAVTMDYSSNNVMKLSVTLTYKYWRNLNYSSSYINEPVAYPPYSEGFFNTTGVTQDLILNAPQILAGNLILKSLV